MDQTFWRFMSSRVTHLDIKPHLIIQKAMYTWNKTYNII